jgi:excinuclease ABC subunit A
MRLLYARAADAFSYVSGEKMVKMTEEQIVSGIIQEFEGSKIAILAPLVKGRKGHYRELFEQIRKQGFTKVRLDGEVKDITPKMQADRYKIHDIEVLIDRVDAKKDNRFRINESVKSALKMGKGTLVLLVGDGKQEKAFHFSKFLMDPKSGISYDEPQPNTFSFNSPYGACTKCDGLGVVSILDENNIIPDKKLSINKGAITPIITRAARVLLPIQALIFAVNPLTSSRKRRIFLPNGARPSGAYTTIISFSIFRRN